AGLVAFSHLQFSQIRGRQPYLIVRNILYVICCLGGRENGWAYSCSFSNSVARHRAPIGSEARSNHSGRPRCKPTISDGVMIVSGARLRFLANENRDEASAVTIKILNTPVIRIFQVIGQRKVQERFVALRDSLHELAPLNAELNGMTQTAFLKWRRFFLR